jgi:ketosteroid isomerase-like protein
MQKTPDGTSQTPRRALSADCTRIVFLAIATIAAAVGWSATPRDPVAEVRAFEHRLEQVYSSQEYIQNPRIAFPYYDQTPRLRMFDAISPLQFKGAEVGQHIVDIGNQFFGTVTFYDMDVSADANLAFASMLQHFTGKLKDGTPVEFIMRVTDCLRWSGDRWLIVQEHISVPIEPAAFAAMIKKKP